MKNLFICLFLLISSIAYAGEFNSAILKMDADGQLSYEKVIKADGQSKEDLYKKAKRWILANVKTNDVNVLFDDQNFEAIITTPTIILDDLKYRHLHDQKVSFKLQIDFKENKMKVVAAGFNYYGIELSGKLHTGESLQNIKFKGFTPNPYPRVSEKFDESFSSFIAALEKTVAMQQKADW